MYEYTKNVIDGFREYVTNSELLSRGWAFQEWILSRRVVCFTPLGTFLQCDSDPHPTNELAESVPIERAHSPTGSSNSVEHTANWFAYWYRVVEAYSGLHLTEPAKDRIMALAGIASEMRQALDSGLMTATLLGSPRSCQLYAAGIWICDIWHGLLWEQRLAGLHERVDGMPT